MFFSVLFCFSIETMQAPKYDTADRINFCKALMNIFRNNSSNRTSKVFESGVF